MKHETTDNTTPGSRPCRTGDISISSVNLELPVTSQIDPSGTMRHRSIGISIERTEQEGKFGGFNLIFIINISFLLLTSFPKMKPGVKETFVTLNLNI